jgi:hypothetical protein
VERDFSPNATQQVNVQVVVPAGATPGNYNFRLDLISVENPDEDYAEGPVITFDVPQLEASKKPDSPIQWGRVLLSAVLAAILSMAIIIVGATVMAKNPFVAESGGNPAGEIVGTAIGNLVRLLFWGLLYFPLATILSGILISLLVQYRRLIHTVLALIVSIPIALVLVWLVNSIM